eukprot:CAMPEP_0115870722 /NCGR_PEP_ID=MMETSP0287-20121206/22480_1 /TAXON_ID=412157 /ORGANISM="Chrysochromulina rotalis, Strain UIO044" /LENGTH=165 /DNA_ID=CAMNT_0003325467 /DNA_START=670 /DNA_END=1167 /DNA_ORIENTATION=+
MGGRIEAWHADYELSTSTHLLRQRVQLGIIISCLTMSATRIPAHGYAHPIAAALLDEAHQVQRVCEAICAGGKLAWSSANNEDVANAYLSASVEKGCDAARRGVPARDLHLRADGVHCSHLLQDTQAGTRYADESWAECCKLGQQARSSDEVFDALTAARREELY